MYNKTKLGCLLLLFINIIFFNDASSQNDDVIKFPKINVSQNSQRIFKEALKDVVFCMRQEYVIKNKKGEAFGHLGKDYFGKEFTIGLLVGADIWFPTYLRKPWEKDPNFLDFKDSHVPECDNLFIKTLSGNLERGLTRLKIDTTDVLSYIKQGRGGLEFSSKEDKSKGYLFLFHIPDKSDEKFPPLDMKMHQMEGIEWNIDGTAQVKNFNFIGKKPIGGVFLIEEISTGKIELKVAGMYVKVGNQWILNEIPASNKSEL